MFFEKFARRMVWHKKWLMKIHEKIPTGGTPARAKPEPVPEWSDE
jgi:hypothetical protein